MKKEFRLILHYVRRYWWQYLLGIAALFTVDRVNALVPQLTGELVDGLGGTAAFGADNIRSIVLRLLGMGAVIAVGRFGWRYFLFGAARCIERDLRYDMFAHLETLSMYYYNEHKTGDLMAHFTNDLMAVRGLLGMTIITIFDATVMLILVLYSMIVYVDARLTLTAVAPMIVIVIGNVFLGKHMHRRFLEKQAAFSDLSDQVQESISGIRVIKAFVQEMAQLRAFAKVNARNREKNMGVVRLIAIAIPVLELIIGLSMLSTLLYGGWLAVAGEITAGQFVAFNSYVGMLVWPMIAVGESVSAVSQGMASVKRIRVILDEEPDIRDEGDPDVKALRGGFSMDHLSFSYPGHERAPALQDISVTVAPGETLAIIGRTGCGKTTFANLLVRLWETEEPGMLTVDGRPIREIPLDVLRRDIAYVPQDSFLFSDTVENNIAFAVERHTHDEVVRVARAAQVHDNIMEFPNGYDTVVGERGVTVSGGQKQRIAIARALMKDAPVLVLDDALSAVDTDTEEQILRNLRALREHRTTVIIAHRISTIQHADHVLVLDDGRMAEYGTHAELLALGGLYRSIYDKQQLEKQFREEHPAEEPAAPKGGDAQ